MEADNVFAGIPFPLPEELTHIILQTPAVRIERIISQGHASPPGFWYDQEENEWVLVLEGRAVVEFEGRSEAVKLQRGSFLNIPAHTRHRVAWCDPERTTVWLAVFSMEGPHGRSTGGRPRE